MNSIEGMTRAADEILNADALIIGAGAGMGVDSGLPDFRGTDGFWKAYPVFKKLGYSFEEMANPEWFRKDPHQAWGFYGHRLNAYRNTEPHEGFSILNKWTDSKAAGGFVFTSNVDGHFQKSGFSEQHVYECHGSINWFQSSEDSDGEIWEDAGVCVEVDSETCRAHDPLPVCSHSGIVARPNILMFGDWMWNGRRSEQQGRRLQQFLDQIKGLRIVVIELGAGKAVPTVRINCERMADALGGHLIRINPRDADGPDGIIPIKAGAMESLRLIDELIQQGLS